MAKEFDCAAHATKAFSDTEGDELYEKRLFKEVSQKISIKKRVKRDTYLSKEAKTQFKIKFLKLYLEDEDFRKEVEDKYILFINQEYIGVYPTINSMMYLGKSRDNKYCIKISGHTEYALAKHSVPIEISKDKFGKDCIKTFKSNGFMSNVENPGTYDNLFEKYMTIDTGCTTTSLLNIDYWDFDKQEFVIYPPNRILKFIWVKEKMSEWNDNKKLVEIVDVETPNCIIPENKIYFDPPLFIKINKVNPIPLYSMLVAQKREDHKLYLLGLDYLTQIRLTICPDEKGLINMDFESL